jgi:hypothetical protein
MKLFSLVPYYFVWHYTLAIKNLFGICGNFIWFLYNFFSFKVLLQTLFSPYKRLTERYNGGLDIEQLLEVIVINILMRLVGFIARSIVLIIGFVVFILALLLIGVGIFVWLLLPFILLFMFFSGLIALVINKQPV